MSQTLTQQPPSPAFTKTPNSANYFQQQYQQAQEQEQNQQPEPNQQQPVQQVIAPPPQRRQNAILPPTPNIYVPPNQPQEQAGSTNNITSEPSAPAALDPALQRQLEAERQAFMQREQQWQQYAQAQQAQLEELQKSQAELAKIQQREAIAQKFANNETFAGLQTVDADDARQLIQLTAEAFEEPLKATTTQLQQMQQQMQQQQQYIQQQTAAMQSQRVRDELLAAHPDFFQLYDGNAAFRQFLNERDGLSSQTREQRAIAEFNAGNAPYLIDLIDKFKGNKPTVNDMRTVAPVQVAQAAAPYQQPAPQAQYTLADLNYFMQTGQISPDQYRVELNKLRNSRAAQTV